MQCTSRSARPVHAPLGPLSEEIQRTNSESHRAGHRGKLLGRRLRPRDAPGPLRPAAGSLLNRTTCAAALSPRNSTRRRSRTSSGNASRPPRGWTPAASPCPCDDARQAQKGSGWDGPGEFRRMACAERPTIATGWGLRGRGVAGRGMGALSRHRGEWRVLRDSVIDHALLLVAHDQSLALVDHLLLGIVQPLPRRLSLSHGEGRQMHGSRQVGGQQGPKGEG